MFLHKVGDISSDKRSEFSLLSDVMGLSSMVDLLALDPSATPGSVLGPFHALGSPWLSNPANGLYWQIDPSQPPDNLCCQLKVSAEGRFEMATIRAVPYEIPTDGPVDQALG
jgi:hypothetical protein